MSKILANQIANYLDNAPIEIKEGLNIPTGKPLQVNGATGTNGQVLTTDGTGLVWANAPYFSGNYNDLTNKPTIPAAQVNSDWSANSGVAQILNKPVVPPTPSVTIAPSPAGSGSLTYNSVSGEFTFTQADLSSYLTTETDPVFSASPAAGITNTNISNWNTAYGWGNHAAQNYITLTNISASTAAASGGGTLTYNNGTGVFTLTPPDLSGYLTAESDTLATVTARGATTTANVTVNDMVVNGDLTVVGTTTSNNQATLNVAATEIVINDGQSGAPALNGSIKIDRGTGTDTAIRWNEGIDIWEFTNDGTVYNPIPTNNNQLTNGAGYLTSYTETDPVFGASVAAGITNTNITNWNTAYGWGDHSTQGYLTAEADTLDTITARGNTTNNGITVGGITVNGNMTVNGTQTVVNTSVLKVSDNEITLNQDVAGTPTENAGIEVERGLSTNVRIRWDETVDRWQFTNNGTNYYNMPTAISDLSNDSGYISSYTETDPVFTASAASSITTQNLTNWNTAYNWGDHGAQGYLVATATDKTNWNTAYGWGDHSTQGYLTSYTETDPVFTASAAFNITTPQITNWDTAHSWGDHAQAGYLTAYTETQTLDDVLSLGATTTRDITTTGKVYFSNNFATLTDLQAVSASTYHGMFAHVHAEGHGYFAHAGGWIQLLDTGSELSEISNVSATAPNTNDVLTWDGANWGPAAPSGGGSSYTDSDVDLHLNVSTASTNEVLSWNGADYAWVSNTGLADVVSDTTPQLGGNLDLNSNNITGTGNINFTGSLTATSIVKSGGTSSQFLKADGSVDSNTYLTSETSHADVVVDGDFTSNGLMSRTGPGTYTTVLDNSGNWDTAYGWGNHANAGYLSSLGSVGGHTDVTITTPLTNQTLVYNGSQWVNQSPSSGLQSRTTSNASTGSITNGASANVTFGAAKSFFLLKVETSAAAWVTFYTDTSSRTSDSARAENTDPLPGSGVLAEVITGGAVTQILTPGTVGWNNDATPSTNLYAKVVNKSGSTANITVTITYVPLEV
jgi:hypothetical protein